MFHSPAPIQKISYERQTLLNISPEQDTKFTGEPGNKKTAPYAPAHRKETSMKKYELTDETIVFRGRKLFRIRALISFGIVKKGSLGGYIEKEANLSHEGRAWVFNNAKVFDNAKILGDAEVHGDAWVCGGAKVFENAQVYGSAKVYGQALVCDSSAVYGRARIHGFASIKDNAEVCGTARVFGIVSVYNNARIKGNAIVRGNDGYATAQGFGSNYRTTTFFRERGKDIGVSCGCFYGNLNDFRQKVKETHGDSKYAREYLQIADLMEFHFNQ